MFLLVTSLQKLVFKKLVQVRTTVAMYTWPELRKITKTKQNEHAIYNDNIELKYSGCVYVYIHSIYNTTYDRHNRVMFNLKMFLSLTSSPICLCRLKTERYSV